MVPDCENCKAQESNAARSKAQVPITLPLQELVRNSDLPNAHSMENLHVEALLQDQLKYSVTKVCWPNLIHWRYTGPRHWRLYSVPVKRSPWSRFQDFWSLFMLERAATRMIRLMSLCLAPILLSGMLLSIRFVVLRRLRKWVYCVVSNKNWKCQTSSTPYSKKYWPSFSFLYPCSIHMLWMDGYK